MHAESGNHPVIRDMLRNSIDARVGVSASTANALRDALRTHKHQSPWNRLCVLGVSCAKSRGQMSTSVSNVETIIVKVLAIVQDYLRQFFAQDYLQNTFPS